MSDYYDADLAALDQIEDLLEAYADARLAPKGPVLARIRAAVVAQAAASAAAASAERRRLARERSTPARWGLPGLHVPRRVVMFGMAATLTLGTSAAVLAAPPGSPFYNARVALQGAFLPNDADARLAAHEQLLDQRMAEAEDAAARGDSVALEAALDAYQTEMDSAVADLGDDADRLARLEDVLGKHVAVLTALEARLPDQAAIEHAIVASQKAVDKLKDKGSHQGGKPSQAPHPTRPPRTDGGDGGTNQTQGGPGGSSQP